MAPERERRHDAEVAAAAAQRPEEIFLMLGVRRHDGAVGEHDLGGDEVVDRQAALARQVSQPAAEREAADTGGRDDSRRDRESVLVGRLVDGAERCATLHAHHVRDWVDGDVGHRREVDHDPAVDRAETGAVVATAADSDGEVVCARDLECGDDVHDVVAAGDRRRPLVDHGVVDGAALVITCIPGADHLPVHARGELAHGRGN